MKQQQLAQEVTDLQAADMLAEMTESLTWRAKNHTAEILKANVKIYDTSVGKAEVFTVWMEYFQEC